MNSNTVSERTDSDRSNAARPADRRSLPANGFSDERGLRDWRTGFTLMEIMLAVLILGIVITTVLASFHTVFSTTTTLENSANYHDMAKTCLNRVTLDLEGLYVSQPPLYKPPEFDNPPDPYRFLGTESNFAGTSFAKLRFTSRAHIPFEKSTRNGIAEIVYYVTAKNDGQLVLKRGDHLYPYPPFEEKSSDPVLCENVKSLAFRYYDADGSELESWDSDSGEYGHGTPRTIAVQLEIGNESESYVFATRIRLPVFRDKHG